MIAVAAGVGVLNVTDVAQIIKSGSSGCIDLFLFLKLWWKVLDDEVVCLHILQHIRMSTALLAQF